MNSEITIEPTPLVWMGHLDDLNHERRDWEYGWAFYTDIGQWATSLDLSPHYLEHVQPVRKPIVVLCPMQAVDGRIIGDVRGDKPNLGDPASKSARPEHANWYAQWSTRGSDPTPGPSKEQVVTRRAPDEG